MTLRNQNCCPHSSSVMMSLISLKLHRHIVASSHDPPEISVQKTNRTQMSSYADLPHRTNTLHILIRVNEPI